MKRERIIFFKSPAEGRQTTTCMQIEPAGSENIRVWSHRGENKLDIGLAEERNCNKRRKDGLISCPFALSTVI